jgi:dolichol-phosphate mannosyltransferase
VWIVLFRPCNGDTGMKYLFLIPTYNESESIQEILLRIDTFRKTNTVDEFAILLIDDNSPDKTADLAESMHLSNFDVLRRSKKMGLGPAYLAGFKWGLARNYDFFIEMDADGSHLPEQLDRLILASKSTDLVIGSRWVSGGGIENWPKSRQVISRCGTWYAGTLLRLPYKDLTSGFRVFSRRCLEVQPLTEIRSKGYGFQVEMALRIHDSGFSILEVPITFVERAHGNSKMTWQIVLEAWQKVTFWGLRRIFTLGVNRR